MRRQVRVADLVAQGVVELNDGYRVKNEELGPAGTPFVRGGDINGGVVNAKVTDHVRPELLDRLNGKIVKPGDVAFITKGTVGRVGRVLAGSPPFVVAPQVCYWRSLDPAHIDPEFLYYLLCGREFQGALDGVKTHGSMVADYVSLSDQMSFRLTLPDLSDQRAIARMLGAMDHKIELNRRMSETLEAMARALFRSWFVDFDPVRARAEGRAPAGMDAATAALFPDGFEKSELGEVPRGWRAGSLGDVADAPRRLVDPGEIDGGMAYIGLEHMPRRSMSLSEWETASKVTSQKARFEAGEILFGKLRPYFHKVGVAPLAGVCSTDIIVAVPKTPEMFALVLGYLASDELIKYSDQCSTGTKMPRVSWADLARYAVALPPAPVAAACTAVVQPLVQRMVAAIHESKALAATRDALLPKLLSGELRVRDAEKAIGQAV